LNHEFYPIPAFDAPVLSRPDVCVIGGGAAGLAAAVAAGRLGLEVVLVEKYGFCGGATVAGLSGTICGLHSSGDCPEQIVFGFAGEFHGLLIERGGAKGPVPFGRTLLTPHDSLAWKEIADNLLEAANVQMLFHTYFLNAFLEGDHVGALLVQTLGGPVVIKAQAIVDASGDALVVHSIGQQTTMGKNGIVQTPTMIFRLGCVDMDAFLQLDPRQIDELVADAHRSGDYDLPRHHVYIFPMPNGREVLCNMTRIQRPDGTTPIGISSEDMTYAEVAGRRQAREYSRFLKERVPAFRHSYMVETGCQVGVRQTRSIVGKSRLTNDDVLQARKFPGAVTHSAWPIENHGANELKIVYLENDHYEIPFETLVPKSIDNVIVAGRCMSAEHEALASARVTAQCFGMGYAAGAAAGLAVLENRSMQSISGPEVRDWMIQRNLKPSDIS
jgi:2-polyprenyl-6-methoxyphenol hydroxylase-like FAD-dependent oxidoreductase